MQTFVLKRDNVYYIEREKFDNRTPLVYYIYRSTFIGRFKLYKKLKRFALYYHHSGLD